MLKIGKQAQVRAKGFDQEITLYDVTGIGGPHKLSLIQMKEALVPLAHEISVSYSVAEGSHINGEVFQGSLTKLSSRQAELSLATPVPVFSNLEVMVAGRDGKRVSGSLFCKVVTQLSENNILLHFTSMSPEIDKFIKGLLGKLPQDPSPILSNADAAEPATGSSTLH
jgi:adenylate cyclase